MAYLLLSPNMATGTTCRVGCTGAIVLWVIAVVLGLICVKDVIHKGCYLECSPFRGFTLTAPYAP